MKLPPQTAAVSRQGDDGLSCVPVLPEVVPQGPTTDDLHAHHADGYIRQWKGTDNAMEAIAAAHNDSLLPIDEMGQAPPKDVAQMLYQFGNGGGRG